MFQEIDSISLGLNVIASCLLDIGLKLDHKNLMIIKANSKSSFTPRMPISANPRSRLVIE